MPALKTLIIIAFAFMIFGCSEDVSSPTTEGTLSDKPSPVSDDIREAIYRYQLQTDTSSNNSCPEILLACIDVDSSGHFIKYVDPSETLIAKLQIDFPKVRKYSQSHFNGVYYYVSDSTKWDILYSIHPWKYSTSKGIKVNGGYYIGNLGAAGYTFYLHQESTMWKVDSLRMLWIS